jgi:hypothetical protein
MMDAFMFMHAGIRQSFNNNQLKLILSMTCPQQHCQKLQGHLIYNIIHQTFLPAERQVLHMQIIPCPGQASMVDEFIPQFKPSTY